MPRTTEEFTYRDCPHCGGTGTERLTGVYAETLKLVRKHPNSHGAALAKIAKCEATAMNNRLSALARMGLIIGERYGRKTNYRSKSR